MTKESNEANNTSVDHPILIWLTSSFCLAIALTGAVMAVLNEQKISELRQEKIQIQALQTEVDELEREKIRLKQELDAGELGALRRLRDTKDGLINDVNTYQADKENLGKEKAELEAEKAELERIKQALGKENELSEALEEARRENKEKKDQ